MVQTQAMKGLLTSGCSLPSSTSCVPKVDTDSGSCQPSLAAKASPASPLSRRRLAEHSHASSACVLKASHPKRSLSVAILT